MEINDYGIISNDYSIEGHISEDGRVYGKGNTYYGRIEKDGTVYDYNNQIKGTFNNKTGEFKDNQGKTVGYVKDNGQITDGDNQIANKIPLLSAPPPPVRNFDSTGLTGFGIFIGLVFLVVGCMTILMYCWLQLILSAIASFFFCRSACI